eukprot:scaffold934_cov132-Cylindrotheca_fusiformis.AAC.2
MTYLRHASSTWMNEALAKNTEVKTSYKGELSFLDSSFPSSTSFSSSFGYYSDRTASLSEQPSCFTLPVSQSGPQPVNLRCPRVHISQATTAKCYWHSDFQLGQLVVNTVMATDIVDKELQALRKTHRWETDALAETPIQQANVSRNDCKAAIAIELLIQASYVSHTMQRWNEKFFKGNYDACMAGPAPSGESETWCGGKLGFLASFLWKRSWTASSA